MRKSTGEYTLAFQLGGHKIKYEREYKFDPDRRWRFDFAFPDKKLAVEVEGGIWTHGRHQRPSGFLKDMEKYNAAAKAGWTVLRFSPQQVKTGMAVLTIADVLGLKL